MDNRLSLLPLFLLDEDATVAQVRTLQRNTGSLNDYLHLLPTASRSDVVARVKAGYDAGNNNLAAQEQSPTVESNFDDKGAVEAPEWLNRFEVGTTNLECTAYRHSGMSVDKALGRLAAPGDRLGNLRRLP